jgi:hypothetical protein
VSRAHPVPPNGVHIDRLNDDIIYLLPNFDFIPIAQLALGWRN